MRGAINDSTVRAKALLRLLVAPESRDTAGEPSVPYFIQVIASPQIDVDKMYGVCVKYNPGAENESHL